MEVHIVADMEVDKVADMAPTEKNEVDVCTKTKLVYARKRSVLGRSCLISSVPDLRVF